MVDPALAQTNGYDFRNDQTGDTYLFIMMEGGLDAWQHSRQEFVDLAGPTPVLPDFAFGTWCVPAPTDRPNPAATDTTPPYHPDHTTQTRSD